MKKLILSALMGNLVFLPCTGISIDQFLRGRNIFGISLVTGLLSMYFLDIEKLHPYGERGYYTDSYGVDYDWVILPDHIVKDRRLNHSCYELFTKFCYTFCGLYALKFGIKGFNKTRSFVQRFRSKPTLPRTI